MQMRGRMPMRSASASGTSRTSTDDFQPVEKLIAAAGAVSAATAPTSLLRPSDRPAIASELDEVRLLDRCVSFCRLTL